MQDENSPIWLPRLAVHGGPPFLQIADALQGAVAGGSLRPGDRLPPQHQLAAQLGIDLTTITRESEQAGRRLHLAVQHSVRFGSVEASRAQSLLPTKSGLR